MSLDPYENGQNPGFQDQLDEDNFWPSFADIMMLVVMVFLMVMIVLMVRNWELLDQLKSSLLAEQKSRQLIETTVNENKTLEERLSDAESELNLLRMQMMQMQDEKAELASSLEKSQVEISQYQAEQEILATTIETAQKEKQNLLTELEFAKQEIEEQSTTIGKLEANSMLKAEEYDSLLKKYEKLIRPARSPKGKIVLEISYVKNSSGSTIFFKPPDANRVAVNQSELRAKLDEWKKQKPDDLYLKIIFPKGSTISHDEAWKFTSDLLKRYDYYYQD